MPYSASEHREGGDLDIEMYYVCKELLLRVRGEEGTQNTDAMKCNETCNKGKDSRT